MTRRKSSRMWHYLGSAGRMTMALSGGALFAYLAWNPKPPPPIHGERHVAQPNARQAVPAASDSVERPMPTPHIERVGLQHSRNHAIIANETNRVGLMPVIRIAVGWSDRSRTIAQRESTGGFVTVNAQSRGPPTSHRQRGKEAVFYPDYHDRTRCSLATEIPPAPSTDAAASRRRHVRAP